MPAKWKHFSTILAVAPLAAVMVFFSVLAGPGLRSGISHDDLMNTYFAWREPFASHLKANLVFWSATIRPLGAVFYATFHHYFGLDPLPYRLFCFTVLYCNIALTCLFAYRLSNSVTIAAITALLHCYHRNFQALYNATGSCYDVFAFFFFYAAFCWYLHIRGGKRLPSPLQIVGLCLLYVCGLNSKEIAVTLPALLFTYELLFHPPHRANWLMKEGRAALITGVLALIYTAGKLATPGSIASIEAYRTQFRITAPLQGMSSYLNDMLCQTDMVTPFRAGLTLLAGLAMALLLRNRLLLFAWALVAIGQLPLSFIPPRGLSAHYLPTVGYALYAAVLLVGAATALTRFAPRDFVYPALFAAVAIPLFRWHLAWGAYDLEYAFSEYRQIAFVRDEFQRHREWFTPGANILIVDDTFQERWASTFLAYLVSREPRIRIDRLPDMNPKPDGMKLASYQHVLAVRDGRFVELVDRTALLGRP